MLATKDVSREVTMGRIVASVRIDNAANPSKTIRCDALVDTGSAYMVLPSAWKERLGTFESSETIELETANQSTVQGEICGPARIHVEGFRPIFTEVLFLDIQPADDIYEPLIGYIVLEQCQAAVDMLGHRLIHVKRMDLK